MPAFQADYPGAIVVPAANYGYAVKNIPRGFVYHTPEEIADDDPQTPGYLASTTREASYTYFVSYLGFVFQLVPEHEGAYANFVNGKPYPFWANPSVNLNLQGISIAFEGMAATIHKTMKRGGPQWKASVALVTHRAKSRNISPGNWTRHKDVSVARSDPGSLDLVAFTLDVKAKMEDDMPTEAEFNALKLKVDQLTKDIASMKGNVPSLSPELGIWAHLREMRKLIDRITGAVPGVSPTQGIWAHIADLRAHADSLHGGGGLQRGDKVTLKDGTLE